MKKLFVASSQKFVTTVNRSSTYMRFLPIAMMDDETYQLLRESEVTFMKLYEKGKQEQEKINRRVEQFLNQILILSKR